MGWFGRLGSERPWAQGCVIAASGLVLAGTSCVGMILSYDMSSRSAVGGLFTAASTTLFGLSLLAIPAGFIWFIVGLVKNATTSRTSQAAAPPPPPPPSPSAGAGGPE